MRCELHLEGDGFNPIMRLVGNCCCNPLDEVQLPHSQRFYVFFCRGAEYESTLSSKQQPIESEHRAKYVTIHDLARGRSPPTAQLPETQYSVTDYEDAPRGAGVLFAERKLKGAAEIRSL